MPAFNMWPCARRIKDRYFDQGLLLSQLKHLVADMFRLDLLDPDKIDANEPLMGGNLGLDSLESLELAICVEEKFGISLCSAGEPHGAFASIASLASFIHARGLANHIRPFRPACDRVVRAVYRQDLPTPHAPLCKPASCGSVCAGILPISPYSLPLSHYPGALYQRISDLV
jgi:acyl carrier protein